MPARGGGGLWWVPAPGGSAPGGGSAPRQVPTPGGSAPGGPLLLGGVWRPPIMATAAGSTHPAGMRSCLT